MSNAEGEAVMAWFLQIDVHARAPGPEPVGTPGGVSAVLPALCARGLTSTGRRERGEAMGTRGVGSISMAIAGIVAQEGRPSKAQPIIGNMKISGFVIGLPDLEDRIASWLGAQSVCLPCLEAYPFAYT